MSGLLRHFVPRNDGDSNTSQSQLNVNHFTHTTHLTHFTHLRKSSAFTLAEILVTLAVIGIVAVMTIPNLVQSYKKKEVEIKLVKFYSMMNNAIKMAEVDYGPQSTWTDYHIDNEQDKDGNVLYDKGNKIDTYVKKYFEPYLKITGSEEIRDVVEPNEPQKVYYLSAGSAFSYNLHENREIIFYPNNPKKCLQESGASGSCLFTFAFIPYSSRPYHLTSYKYNISNGMQPALYLWDGKDESLAYGCKETGFYCAEVIRRNGWKIPDDYPYKF